MTLFLAWQCGAFFMLAVMFAAERRPWFSAVCMAHALLIGYFSAV